MGRPGAIRLVALLLLATLPGCATYTAIRMEGPKGDENVGLGMDRRQVERLIQTGAVSEYW